MLFHIVKLTSSKTLLALSFPSIPRDSGSEPSPLGAISNYIQQDPSEIRWRVFTAQSRRALYYFPSGLIEGGRVAAKARFYYIGSLMTNDVGFKPEPIGWAVFLSRCVGAGVAPRVYSVYESLPDLP
jgi:hypothetical protein